MTIFDKNFFGVTRGQRSNLPPPLPKPQPITVSTQDFLTLFRTTLARSIGFVSQLEISYGTKLILAPLQKLL